MSATHYRYAHDENGVQRRFFELRYDDGERRVSGTAMRYGDVAVLPWGEKERFEPGAFGEVGGLDVILNVQHDRAQPIARTTGGTLRLSDTGGELAIDATLPDTTIANDAVANVRAKILRGFSVEFMPKETRKEDGVIIVEKATLPAIGLVDRPAYKKSKVLPRSEDDMNDTEIQDLVKRSVTEALAKRSDPAAPPDAAAIATAVSGAIGTALADMPTAESVREQVDAALAKRDEAEAARAKAEDEKAAMKKKAKDDEEMAKKDRAKIEADAEFRAELITMCRSADMFPKDFDPKGKTRAEILVAAVGDEVTDAAKRSEEYLFAKVETIAERRAAAAKGNPTPANPGAPAAGGGVSPVNMTRFIEQKQARRAASA